MCITLAACSSTVAGSTYKYESVEIVSEIPAEAGITKDELKGYVEEEYKNYEATFNKDNTVTVKGMGDMEDDITVIWKQDGKKVSIGYKYKDGDTEKEVWEGEGTYEYTVDGNKLVAEVEMEGITIKLTFVKA